RYSHVAQSKAGATKRDTITDFQLGADKLDLRSIDANSLLSFNQAFSCLGESSTFTNAGQLRYELGGGNLFLFVNTYANLATSEF
ncbi:MAG: M10 family metallopeptidase C-terminal domain-containing protein, partial [Cyanobacteriota bacterium]